MCVVKNAGSRHAVCVFLYVYIISQILLTFTDIFIKTKKPCQTDKALDSLYFLFIYVSPVSDLNNPYN